MAGKTYNAGVVMRYLFFLIIAISSVFFGCQGEKGADGETKTIIETIYVDRGTDAYKTYYPSGYAQDGPYLYGADVRFYRQEIGTQGNVGMYQTGAVFQTITNNDYGHYFFDGGITGRFGEVFVDGYMFNEISGITSDRKTLNAIIDLEEAGPRNVNPLTTMRTPIQRYLYNNDYINDVSADRIADSRDEAETRILNFFNMPSIPGQHFEDLDLSGDTKGDAVLTAVNIMLLWDSTNDALRSTADQTQIMTQIAGSLKTDASGNAQLKLRLAQDGAGLADKITDIRDNLESYYHSLGELSFSAPNFWDHLDFDLDGIRNDDDPDSYIEILSETHEIKGHARIADSCNTSFDTSDQRFFAQPFVFDSSISTSKYFTSNFESEYMSIYSVDGKGTVDTSDDTPGLPLTVFSGSSFVPKLPVDFFKDQYVDASDDSYSVPQAFNAVITGHTIPVGTNVYIVFWSDAGYRPTGLCQGGDHPFSRGQYSSDGVSWIGSAPLNLTLYTRFTLMKAAWLD